MKNKSHLTLPGLAEIKAIKSGMNTKRGSAACGSDRSAGRAGL
jgi:hypothetical protein